MRVRIKTWLPTIVGLLAFGAVAGEASAQCNSGCAPPPPPCCSPPPPPPPPAPCCQPPAPPGYPGGGNFNVNVNVNAGANASANAGARSAINARGRGDVYVGGGGGAYFSVEQPYPTVIQGLNVEAAAMAQVVRVPYSASRWSAKRVVIQAFCIDDRDVPHPASQVQPGRDIHDGYDGELYRCIAGTRLQFTFADFLDQINFDHGQTMSCRKGESLWYGKGGPGGAASAYAAEYAEAYAGGHGGPGGPLAGGVLECRPQKPERDCNERSLLRRYGAGVKVLTMWREETYTEYREETVQAAGVAVMGSSLTLDGGVGGRVF